MIIFEKSDGTVALYYGDVEEADYLAAEDYLLTLPNTVSFTVDLYIYICVCVCVCVCRYIKSKSHIDLR